MNTPRHIRFLCFFGFIVFGAVFFSLSKVALAENPLDSDGSGTTILQVNTPPIAGTEVVPAAPPVPPGTPLPPAGGGATPTADGDKKVTTFTGLLGRLNSLINALIPFIVGLAVFVIIWGIFVYVAQAGDEEKRVQARKFIVWGVIGVFFMLSVWGLVNILVNSINLEKTINTSDIPRVPGIGGTDGTDGRPNGMNDGTDLSGVCTNGLDSFNNPC
ncbi:MAG TPA: hypothetical protein DEP25_01935 [Candidatus Taylorbacteria bacterium]|nr:hypothetical protein [Candidatus Taylorbacteria bacterium]